MKTALIYHHDDALDRQVLPRWLASFSDVVGLVSVEEGAGQRRARLRRELKRVGYVRLLDVLAYRLYHRLFVQASDAVDETRLLTRLVAAYPTAPANAPVLTTATPNSPETRAFLETVQPDLMIARCKVILKPEVFTVPRLGTYVMHPGICPEYRNAHGCFWALAHNDVDKVGMTLLRADAGIDTGPILGFFSYPYDEAAESHVTIQRRAVFENLDRVRDKLLKVERGAAPFVDTRGRKSANWGQPWLSKYVSWRVAARRRLGR